MKHPLAVAIFLLSAPLAATPASGKGDAPSLAFSTNLAYFGFSAFMSSPSRATILFPLDCQIALDDSLSLHPALGMIWSADMASGTHGFLYEAECSLAWRPARTRLAGWYVAAGPGISLSDSSTHVMLVANAEGGYQWIAGKGLLLGLGGGGRLVIDATDGGYIVLPDVKLRLGWVL